MNRVVLLPLALVMAAGRLTVAAPLPEPVRARIDRFFAKWDKPDSPGVALGVIQDGQLVYKRGYGMANLEHDIPISAKSVFRIGSTSKQFTAACVLLAARQGKLSLDDDIRKYVPKLREYESPITIRHLIHHTSGIPGYLNLMKKAGKTDDDFYRDQDVIDLLAQQERLDFAPGTKWKYSNSGYFLLSIIIKKATGRTLREFADEYLFGPLGMSETHFHDDHTMIVKNRADGYAPGKHGGFRISMTTLDMIGDGGVFTTVDDLLMWDRNFYDPKVGGRDFIKQQLTPGTLSSGKSVDYAYGLMVSQHGGRKLISHGGSFVGFRAEMLRFPDEHLSVICLANLATINPTRLALSVADTILAGKPKK